MNGYCGKMLFVDLTKGSHEVLALTEDMAKQYIGGYGIGAKVLFERMKPGSDALGPDNIVGPLYRCLQITGKRRLERCQFRGIFRPRAKKSGI